jgi:tetratricopeptide (TPR) repeat protein
VVELGFDARTTDGAVAARNLDAQIEGMELALARRPHDGDLRRAVVERRLLRASMFGRASDYDAAFVVAEGDDDGVDDRRALVLSAVHRFAEAEAALARATMRDGRPRDTTGIDLAIGRDLPGVVARREAAVGRRRTFGTLGALASAYAAVGRWDDADRGYRDALAEYRDVSPFPVAAVQFQRGMMWSEMAGQPERARPLYEEAVARVPGYVVANVHLAELEGERTPHDAIARLRPFVVAEDPEPRARIAGLVDGVGDPVAAASFTRDAIAGYDALLARHRAAYLDHASELYLGAAGRPATALALAEENLVLRATDRAYELAITAALGAGRASRACELAARVGEGRPSVPLADARMRALATCGP